MMTSAQREALGEHDLTLVSTLMGNKPGEYILLARQPDDDGTPVLIDMDGTVHPYVDSRAGSTRVTLGELPPA